MVQAEKIVAETELSLPLAHKSRKLFSIWSLYPENNESTLWDLWHPI